MPGVVGPADVQCFDCNEWVDFRDVYWVGIRPFCFECRLEEVAAPNDGKAS